MNWVQYIGYTIKEVVTNKCPVLHLFDEFFAGVTHN